METMTQPEILRTAFAVEKTFAPLERIGLKAYDDDHAEQFDAACNKTQELLAGVEKGFGLAEMKQCAERVQFYLIGRGYHIAAQAVSMLMEDK